MTNLILFFIFLAAILACITLASINRKLGAILRQLERTHNVNVSTMEIAGAALSTANVALTAVSEATREMQVLGAAMSEVARSIDDAQTGDIYARRN